MPNLQRLELDAFRGATRPATVAFDPFRRLTIVFGENGTGKSTIIDALDLLGSDEVGSIRERGLGGSLHKYWASQGRMLDEIRLALVAESSTYSVRVSNTGRIEREAVSDRPRVSILRRKLIRDLVDAEPRKKYEALAAFVDVGNIERSEDRLRDAIREYESRRDTSLAVLEQSQSAVETMRNESPEATGDWRTWAEEEIARSDDELDEWQKCLKSVIDSVASLKSHRDRLELENSRLSDSLERLAQVQEQRALALHKASADLSQLLPILEAVDKYLDDVSSLEDCPACGQPVEFLQIRGFVSDRLNSLQEVRALEDVVAKIEKQLERIRLNCDECGNAIVSETESLISSRVTASLPPDIATPPFPTSMALPDIELWLESAISHTLDWGNQLAVLNGQLQYRKALRKHWGDYTGNLQNQQRIEDLLPALRRALTVVEGSRKLYVSRVLESIASEVGELYETIHPGEGRGNIEIKLIEGRRGSIELSTSFNGESVPPSGYVSDSHIDSLGLCVFIALAKRENPDSTILVLDDVLGSVDEPHVDRVIELVYSQATHFRHCLVTTHYRPWREKYRWGKLRTGYIHFIELGAWTEESGIVVGRSLPSEWDLIRALVANSPVDWLSACSKAGVVLEAVLNFLTTTYECEVRRKIEGRYEIGDLMKGLSRGLKRNLAVEIIDPSTGEYSRIDLGLEFDRLSTVFQARNLMGSHFNEIAFGMPEGDAREFVECVMRITDALVDDECGWPNREKTGLYLQNRSDSRRLYPVKRVN